jgi:hypothetical protein
MEQNEYRIRDMQDTPFKNQVTFSMPDVYQGKIIDKNSNCRENA